jgi:hypothetical protein
LDASTLVDFEGVPFDEFIFRPAGYEWDGLVAGVDMYQIDALVQNYYGTPFLSDFLASTFADQPIIFDLPPETNAIGGQWFHSQIDPYNGVFTLTLEDQSTFEHQRDDIATGRELNEPDFTGFISDDQNIVSIEYRVKHDNGASAGAMADNVQFGAGTPDPCRADINNDGVVNIDDLFAVLGDWGPCDDCASDVNCDGAVDIDDLFAVLGDWGPCLS